MPGGVATTVREWVVEASQPLWQNRHRGEEEWDLTLQVGDVRRLEGLGNGVMLARTSDGGGGGGGGAGNGEKGWLLMGQGKGREQDEHLRRGMTVVVRRPTWEVRLGQEDWGVAVEWTVLRNTG